MSCCSSNITDQTASEFSTQTGLSADRLAALLAQTPEYQEFARLGRQIRLDPEVQRLSMAIRRQQRYDPDPQGPSLAALVEELEDLPAVLVYRKAEAAIAGLLRSVDQVISAAAGVAFAPNAVKSGCG